MKTIFFILIAFMGYDVQGIKVRAIRRRWIQYPSNHITSPKQMQYYHWLSQNQRPLIYRNGRLIYSYLDPVGMRFNMFGGTERYKAYLKKYGHMGYQSVNQYGPGYGIKGIAKGQSDNSGYEGLSGPSVYQNYASGKPVNIYAGYKGINGYGGHREQSVYHSLEGFGSGNADFPLEQNGIEPGHIDQSLYQSWQSIAPGGQLGVSMEQNGVDSRNEGHVEHTFQNLQSSASINPIDISVGQSGVSSGNGKSLDQSLYQNLQIPASRSPAAVADIEMDYGHSQPIDQSLYQNLQSPKSPVRISLEQSEISPEHANQLLYETFQKSAPGGRAILREDHDDLISENKNQPIELDDNFQNFGKGGRINLSVGQNRPNLIYGGDSNYPLEQNLPISGQTNYLVQQTGQNSENEGQSALSIAQGETNGDHDIKIHNEEDIVPIQHNTDQHDFSYSIDNKPNWSSVAPLQGVLKDVNINKESISPVGIETGHHVVSPENKDINSVDQTKFTDKGPVKDILQQTYVNGKENYNIMSDNEGGEGLYLENQSKLELASQVPVKNPVEETPVDDEEKAVPVTLVTENIFIPSGNRDILPNIVTNDQNNRASIIIMPENDLISSENERVNAIDKSELLEATGRPLKEILDERNANNKEIIAPASIPLGSAPSSPVTDFSSLYQTNLNWVNKAPTVMGESIKMNDKNPVSLNTYTGKPNQLQSNGYVTTWNQVTRKLEPVVIPYNTQFGNVQWMKPATGNTPPPRDNNVYSSVCENPNTNLNMLSESKGTHNGVNGMPQPNIQDIIKNLQNKGIYYYPTNTYKNIETPRNTNGQYPFNNFKGLNDAYVNGNANPNFYKKEIFSYYNPGNIYLNAYNIPYPNYQLSATSPTGPKKISIQSEILKPTDTPLSPFVFEENREIRPKIPDSGLILIKPNVQQKKSQPSAIKDFAEFTTGFIKPRQPSLKQTPNQYVYQIQEALEPELMRLYHSKCSTGHDTQLLKEIKKLIDSIQVEHCEIM